MSLVLTLQNIESRIVVYIDEQWEFYVPKRPLQLQQVVRDLSKEKILLKFCFQIEFFSLKDMQRHTFLLMLR